ncbi:MAG: anhydro-N-acetylmuramic acid kinase [Halieaceae bacterium]
MVTAKLLVGLMSGTSMDAIDAALVHCGPDGVELIDCQACPVSPALRDEIHQLSHPGDAEIERLGRLDRKLGQAFADVTLQLLEKAGVEASEVHGIGCHGQTVRHHPPSAGDSTESAFTLQIGDPNTIAEITGIDTVADFRRRDIAAGGEGAPLAPAFHSAAFSSADHSRAIVNIGGIANITLLQEESVTGFDSGPGNTLMDQWILQVRGEHYDRDGAWAAEGSVQEPLLNALQQHPYLALSAPKSTGKEAFNLAWLQSQLDALPAMEPGDVQATLAQYTANTIYDALRSGPGAIDQVFVCGGGAANSDLMRRLYEKLDPVYLGTTAELGCDPDWVEAAAFAWLAWRRLEQLSGNIPGVTGASGERILGAVYAGAK